jgi:hypothetical protein
VQKFTQCCHKMNKFYGRKSTNLWFVLLNYYLQYQKTSVRRLLVREAWLTYLLDSKIDSSQCLLLPSILANDITPCVTCSITIVGRHLGLKICFFIVILANDNPFTVRAEAFRAIVFAPLASLSKILEFRRFKGKKLVKTFLGKFSGKCVYLGAKELLLENDDLGPLLQNFLRA